MDERNIEEVGRDREEEGREIRIKMIFLCLFWELLLL
jgi:hypothetical protein